jgi:hypothetical protein
MVNLETSTWFAKEFYDLAEFLTCNEDKEHF